MEPQHHHEDNGNNGKGSSNFLCRQTSTRWTPTTDQIRILKDLYYNKNIRSPSADQIQKISARLREYGKIEGKNVFYWFQNHKARERQKKRFNTTDHVVPMQKPTVAANGGWKVDESIHNNNKFTHTNSGYSSSSNGMLTVGQIGNYGYGSMTMEKSFRECSISACGSSITGANDSLRHNFGWVGIDPTYSSTSYTFFDHKKLIDEILEEDDEDDNHQQQQQQQESIHVAAPHIKTLPLFPMHGEDIKSESDNCYSASWYMSDNDGYSTSSRASLELSLNTYTGRSQN